MRVNEGRLIGTGMRFGIVVARWNDLITRRLLDGAVGALKAHDAAEEALEVAWVPGSFEVPLMAREMARSGRFDAVVALGCLIRGATDHYALIAANVTSAIQQAMLETGVPIAFGVLTTDTIEQAIERAGTKAGNKGAEAALAALELANLMKLYR
ncbi:6,7-dimethyl-8-ribityllumazine synthase [Calidithermus roseus]|uniref:6,7-dimethyl-8-ribityllumazine synthase n=1 Tax=Calidithermus roseus TaxID=1644118 RepID=A0A399EU56_9DEIN|nr:6,7-dimethyl-8-ribityllumazine synthase [Calidithermus roseus]RIH86142.1 6,7-dimethyl-8-ribityllumazine synthase [Calidithermus roseus]